MLLEKHLRIILWHHRIELSLGDTISDVCGANHIQWFMDKLYSLYSQSGKVRELEELSRGLGKEILKIGKCLDTRWVASSFRTVSAVWNDFEALCHHFEAGRRVETRSKCEQPKFHGLLKRMASKKILQDLELMYDVLEELAITSEALQKRNTTLVYADKLIRLSISYIESMKERKGEKFLEVAKAVEEMKFRSVNLTDNGRMVTICYEQFLTSLVDGIRVGMLSPILNTIISELSVLEEDNWPNVIPPFYGRNEIRSLSERFQLNFSKAITPF